MGTLVLHPWSSSSLVSGGTANLTGSASISGMTYLSKFATYNFNSGSLRWCLTNEAVYTSDPGMQLLILQNLVSQALVAGCRQ